MKRGIFNWYEEIEMNNIIANIAITIICLAVLLSFTACILCILGTLAGITIFFAANFVLSICGYTLEMGIGTSVICGILSVLVWVIYEGVKQYKQMG
jgi:hypothetical protein